MAPTIALKKITATVLVLFAMASRVMLCDALIAASRVNFCKRHRAEQGRASNCTQLLTLSLTPETSEDFGAEEILLTGIDDETNVRRELAEPVKISLRKLPTRAAYPLRYIQEVNVEPYEVNFSCGYDECPRVAERRCPGHGFCCQCPLCSSFLVCGKHTLRSGHKCGLFDPHAHITCVLYNNTWYSVFAIESPKLLSLIEIRIELPRNRTVVRQVGTLVPDAHEGDISLHYTADFAASSGAPLLSDRYLIQDRRPGGEVAILDRSLFALDGSECNKIGVSTHAFMAQGSRCQAPKGSCLRNQLAEIRSAAEQRRAERLPTKYFPADYGTFLGYHRSKSVPPEIVYGMPPQRLVSLVTIRAAARDLFVELAVIRAQIHDAAVSNGTDVLYGGPVTLAVMVTSQSDITGMVTLQCNATSTTTFPAVKLTLPPFATRQQNLESATTSEGLSQVCHLELLDVEGAVLDRRVVAWTLRKQPIVQRQLGPETPEGVGHVGELEPPRGKNKEDSCTDCPWYNPLCFVVRKCFWQAAAETLLVLCVLVAVVKGVLWWFRRRSARTRPTAGGGACSSSAPNAH